MSFPRYPSYKPSGVEWLGEVPAHWEVIRLKNVLQQRITDGPHTTPTFTADGVPFLSVDGIQDGELNFDGCRFISEADHAEFRVKALPKKNDLLMGKAASTGKIARVKVDFEFSIWSPLALIRLESPVSNSAFFEQCLKSPIVQAQIDNFCTSNTQKNISMDDIPRLVLTRPPRDEQTRIAEFLDEETAKIDGLVAEQLRLMELLKEKRQAVISHAVTRGLNPKAPLKPSGIEWLGDVPAHWEITPLKWLTDPERPIMYGIVLPGPDVGEGIPILKGGNIRPSRMNLQSMARTTAELEAPYARARLKEGDLVYSIRGTIGDCEIVPAELEGSNITQDVARVAITRGICAPWGRWALLASAIRDDLACGSLGAAVRGINIFDLKRANIPTPPPKEQTAIAAFLDAETSRFDTLTAEAQRAIDLLQERRTALISAAVTGQIDVRGT
ncbi:MAG: restriction endonuclease subunit S [Phycisphaerae bacterium]|jgi:type I restriction enzyme S subunit